MCSTVACLPGDQRLCGGGDVHIGGGLLTFTLFTCAPLPPYTQSE
jgi:hypothetical protein